MLRIENLSIPPDVGEEALRARAAHVLRLRPQALRRVELLRRSIDARDGVHLVCSVAVEVENEAAVLRRVRSGRVSRLDSRPAYVPPAAMQAPALPPVVVGAGPAGLFCTLVLARAGLRPILIEQGRRVEERKADVERFWRTGVLDPSSNVQFGEGGAGAFSDGKLNTGTRDPRHRFILETLTACGAPEDILVDAKPHVGTDMLHRALIALRQELLSLGADLRFGTRLTDLHSTGGVLEGITVTGPGGEQLLPCRHLALCPGHSARETFQLLRERGVPMEAKPFAVGVRIEHRQADMDAAQYKEYAGSPALPASTYKLSCHLPDGRGVFSFCVCPGGQVVAAASEPGRLVTNGMSEFARDRENINGGLLVGITPADFGGERDPLAGVAFQRKLEEAAFALGGSNYRAPAQRVGDFLAGRPSQGPGAVSPSYLPGVTWTDLHRCLPPFIAGSLAQALPILGRKLRGFDAPDAVLTAVESRSSSPVRIPRDDHYCSALRGLYPCSEGAGYAGGILSAAADGMRTAEMICTLLQQEELNHES